MLRLVVTILAFLACLSQVTADVELSKRDIVILRDMLHGGNGYGQKMVRQSTPWKNILSGLLRSQRFSQLAASIPCGIISTLENDAAAAETFVQQIEAGQVPDLIQNLPDEIVSAFTNIVYVVTRLPEAVIDDIGAAADDAVDFFEDLGEGDDFFSEIATLGGDIVSEVVTVWDEVTAELVDGWNAFTQDVACFFEGCAPASARACAPSSYYAVASVSSVYASASGLAALSSAAARASAAASIVVQASSTAYYPASASSFAYGSYAPSASGSVAGSSYASFSGSAVFLGSASHSAAPSISAVPSGSGTQSIAVAQSGSASSSSSSAPVDGSASPSLNPGIKTLSVAAIAVIIGGMLWL